MKSTNLLLFLLMCCLFAVSCDKEDEGPDLPTSKYYLTGNFDGTDINIDAGNGNEARSACTEFGRLNGGFWSTVGSFPIETIMSIGMDVPGVSNYPTEMDLYEAYALGSKGYADCVNGVMEGAVVEYTDDAGVLWTSGGAQSASSFEITERSEWDGVSAVATIDVKGTFNCTLYNDAGETKTFSNGTFSTMVAMY